MKNLKAVSLYMYNFNSMFQSTVSSIATSYRVAILKIMFFFRLWQNVKGISVNYGITYMYTPCKDFFFHPKHNFCLIDSIRPCKMPKSNILYETEFSLSLLQIELWHLEN